MEEGSVTSLNPSRHHHPGVLLVSLSLLASALILWSPTPLHAAILLACGIALLFLLVLALHFRPTMQHVDILAWTLLIVHTLSFLPARDPRLLAREQSATPFIMFQVGVWLLVGIYSSFRLLARPRPFAVFSGPAVRAALMFAGLALASTSYSVAPSITLVWALKLPVILMAAGLFFDHTRPLASCRAFYTATFVALLTMLLAFTVLGVSYPDRALSELHFTGGLRLGGTIISPTALAGVAGLAALLSLIDFIETRKRLSLFVLLLTGAVMAATMGRGAIMATLVTSLFVCALRRRTIVVLAGASAAAIIFLAFPSLGVASYDTVTRQQTFEEMMSLTGRVPLWEASLSMFIERPMLGWGYVSGSRVGLASYFTQWAALDAHNALLQVLLTLGLLGMLLFVRMFYLLVKPHFVVLLRSMSPSTGRIDDMTAIRLRLVVCVMFFLVHGLFEGGLGGAPKLEACVFFGLTFVSDSITRIGRLE
jgi:hypothetical protein